LQGSAADQAQAMLFKKDVEPNPDDPDAELMEDEEGKSF
jgi:hypothetical protein